MSKSQMIKTNLASSGEIAIGASWGKSNHSGQREFRGSTRSLDISERYHRLTSHSLTVPVCSLFIGLISAYDSYLTVKYVDFLQGLELNPIGRWLMGLDEPMMQESPQIALFLGCKFAGTVIVLFVLQMLWMWRRKLSGVVALKVAFAQFLLACVLLFWPNS